MKLRYFGLGIVVGALFFQQFLFPDSIATGFLSVFGLGLIIGDFARGDSAK